MDTTVVAHFRDQWDHFRAGEGGGTVVMIVEYYSEVRGTFPTRLILKFLIKIPMPFGAFWMTSFLSFLSNL